MEEKLSYKVSTITMSMKIPDCNLNLINIGKYMKIDENIIGIKYNFSISKSSILKGKYSTCTYNKSKIKNQNKINQKLFYNQISIIIRLPKSDYNINVKLFGNGSLHLTGIKDPSDGRSVVILLYKKLLELTDCYDTVLISLDTNNVYLDNNNNIYSKSYKNKKIIGFKYKNQDNINLYNIHKKDYIIENNVFVSYKYESKRTKTILNFDGIKIGYSKIELLKNKSKLYKNNKNINIDMESNLIYYDNAINSQVIGKINYNYNENVNANVDEDEDEYEYEEKKVLEYNYSCTPFISHIQNLDNLLELSDIELGIDINCINIYFKLDFLLNRQRLFNKLYESQYTCEYKPEKYSGVKLRYKINIRQDTGICNCINKCTCNNITFLIFQSGNIIAMGFKSIEYIQDILDKFNIIILSIKDTIKKKMLV